MAINMMHFEITLAKPSNHLFQVKLTFQGNGEERFISLPNWIRGSYMIRDFSKNITQIKAYADDKEIPLLKINKSLWKVAASAGLISIVYDVYAMDLSVRSAHMDHTHAFFNGTSLYLAIEDLKDQPVNITIHNPMLSSTQYWTVKTTLDAENLDAQGFGEYSASDYEDAIDHPVEISHSHDLMFNVESVPHLLHFSGDFPAHIDDRRLADDLKKICLEQSALFKDGIPFESYRFLTMVAANSYGGLEHRSSTALICMPGDIPTQLATDEKNYQKFLGLCSHEYFHSWNVKRITPANFQTSDLSSEAHSSLLWAFEGITSYYDDLALLRCGVISLEDYLGLFAQTLTRLQRARGRHLQSVADSSFDAWTKFYKQDENALNAIVSYYTKGAVIALCLDLEIRRQTENRYSLDDVMRELWHQFGKRSIPIDDQDLEAFIVKVTSTDLSEFFNQAIRGTQDIDVQSWLLQLGIGLNYREDKGNGDNGGYVKAADTDTEAKPLITLGCQLKADSTEVQFVYNDSVAEDAGISAGDQLLALNGQKISYANFQRMLDTLALDEPASVHFFRRDRLYQTTVKPQLKTKDTCELYLLPDDELTQQQIENRQHWMRSSIL